MANAAGNRLAGFAVVTTTAGVGTLTSVGPAISLPVPPTAMAITLANSFLYVAGPGGVYGFSIDASSGVLTALLGGGVEAVTAFPMASLDVSPDGRWLFGLSLDGQTLYEWGIESSTGALTLQEATTYSVSGATVLPKMVRVAPNGAYVVLALGTGGDAVFPFTTATGVLGAGQEIGTGSVLASDNAVAIDSASTFLYIARSGAGAGVAVFKFNPNGFGATGGLIPVPGSPFASGGGSFALLLDSTGKYLYAGNRQEATIGEFAVGPGGTLTAVAGSPVLGGSLISSLAKDNSGRYVLAVASGGSPDLAMYGFDAATPGKLDPQATVATGSDPVTAVLVVATH